MKKHLSSFIGRNIIITFIGLLLAFFGREFIPTNKYFYIFLIPIIALAINTVAFAVATSTFVKRNANTMFTALFGIKFFSYALIALIFFLLEDQKSTRLHFILYLFIIYILNTYYLVVKTLKYLKD